MIYLVSPESLRSWFHPFSELSHDDVVAFIGEQNNISIDSILSDILETSVTYGKAAVIYSSHASLRRDCVLAAMLRRAGHTVAAQTPACASLGLDKVKMKKFFDNNHFNSPEWYESLSSVNGNCHRSHSLNQFVIKKRCGTQGDGSTIGSIANRRAFEGRYAERFVSGEEYSVVAFRSNSCCITYPPVWKGPTREDLLPPYRRLRLCPYPGLDPECDASLRRLSLSIAERAGALGFMEVEFVVSQYGEIHTLEINPRISGTMRISAMATGIKIFDFRGQKSLPTFVQPCRQAVEVPYSGVPVTDPVANVFATSRLTVSASDLEQAYETLVGLARKGVVPEASALETLRGHLQGQRGSRTGILPSRMGRR